MILVTGATGNVGRELVPRLTAMNGDVRVLVRDERKTRDFDSRVQCVIGDLDRPETLVPAMSSIESLYLVTAVTGQVRNLLEAAKRAGVRHIVKQSTIEANRSLGPGRWHREQEQMIEDSGIGWTFLRPTMMMVNTQQWWSKTIRYQGRVYFPAGKGKVSPVAPRDVAAVASVVLGSPAHVHQTYELTGPELLTAGEMVDILSKVLEKPLRYVRIPAFVARLWMRRAGLPKHVVNGLMETLNAWQRSEYTYVSDAVERLTGHSPQMFESWCREHCDLFETG